MKGPSGSKAGIFGGDNMVLDKISKHKKVKAAKAKAKPAKMVAITETKAAKASTLAMKSEPYNDKLVNLSSHLVCKGECIGDINIGNYITSNIPYELVGQPFPFSLQFNSSLIVGLIQKPLHQD